MEVSAMFRTWFFLILILPASAGAATYVINATGTPGTDCFSTVIQDGVDAASPGDSVVVLPGVYTHRFLASAGIYGTIWINIKMKSGVVLRSQEGPRETIIDGEGVARLGVYCSNLNTATRIEGLTFVNNEFDGFGCIQNSSPHIVGNWVYNYGHSGIWTFNSGTNPRIRSNVFWNGDNGVWCDANATIENNTFINNHYGIGVNGASVQAHRYLIIGFSRGGIRFDFGSLGLSCNDVFGDLAPHYIGISPGSGDFSLDPEFCADNPGGEKDFGLWNTSPCLPAQSSCGVLVGAYGEGCGAEVVEADIDLQPNVLNLQSRGLWVTCYLELPDPYAPSEIDLTTVMLGGELRAEMWPWSLGDQDGDGILDLMVKFDRAETIAFVKRKVGIGLHGNIQDGAPVVVEVSGQMGGTDFVGSDEVVWRDREYNEPEIRSIPGDHLIRSIAPNPFNPVTRISYSLTNDTEVQLVVYDLNGALVKTLESGTKQEGEHVTEWDGRDSLGRVVASGVYIINLTARDYRESRKAVLLK
jgi:hypothetical protein